MKKSVYLAVIFSAAFLTSCIVQQKPTLQYMPKASNTINTVRFDELNLDKKDYTILKNVTADATFIYDEVGENLISITEQNGEFSVSFAATDPNLKNPQNNKKAKTSQPNNVKKEWHLLNFSGIAYFGYLSNDYGDMSVNKDPEYYSRRFAFYRLINQCKAIGGDALIEPVVSTIVQQQGTTLIFKTTVTAKVVIIKTDK